MNEGNFEDKYLSTIDSLILGLFIITRDVHDATRCKMQVFLLQNGGCKMVVEQVLQCVRQVSEGF